MCVRIGAQCGVKTSYMLQNLEHENQSTMPCVCPSLMSCHAMSCRVVCGVSLHPAREGGRERKKEGGRARGSNGQRLDWLPCVRSSN